jgi:CelD/BcsL family acetyltransferase involved in cellulose biosynthesis
MTQRVRRNNCLHDTDGFDVQAGPPPPEAELAALWRKLEANADGSFFQSWDWTGCLFAERFPDPVLVRVARGGETKALALFNRGGHFAGGERLRLGESGTAMDGVFIEHNGPLVALDAPRALELCLAAALTAPRRLPGRILVLSGIGDAGLAALRRLAVVRCDAARQAPRIDLAAMRQREKAVLDLVSANTRYQLRRALRRYEQAGPIRIRRAATVEEARRFLDALAVLHTATWRARGLPGTFAEPAFYRFHAALISGSHAAGVVDLLEITAGPRVIGYLLNFIHGNRVYAYQSGFNYADAQPHEKPGLVCHHAAITHYAAQQRDIYDFLAGDDRYKASFADHAVPLYWVRAARALTPGGEMLRLHNIADGLKTRARRG